MTKKTVSWILYKPIRRIDTEALAGGTASQAVNLSCFNP